MTIIEAFGFLLFVGGDSSEDEYAKVDWDNLGFGITPVDYMYTMKCSSDGKFEQGQLAPYGNVDLSPSAAVLNYGQASCNFNPFSIISIIPDCVRYFVKLQDLESHIMGPII